MKNYMQVITKFILAIYLSFEILRPAPVYADLLGGLIGGNSGGTPSGTPSAPLNLDECESFCDQFGKGTASGITSSTWDSQSDQLCTEVGSPTAQSYLKPVEPDKALSDQYSCTIPITQNLITAAQARNASMTPETTCAEVGRIKDRCKYHNSQVEPQCVAFNGLNQAHTLDTVIAALDVGVVGVCGAACAMKGSVLMEGVCAAASTAEGVAELVATVSQESSGVSHYVSLLGGAVGVAGGAASLIMTAKNAQAAREASKEAAVDKATKSNLPDPDGLDRADDGPTKAGDAAKTGDKAGDAAEKSGKKRNTDSCLLAALFAVLAGVRIYNLYSMNSDKKDTCKKVQSLRGSMPSPTPAAQNVAGQAGSSGTVSFGRAGGTGGSTGASAADKLAAFTNCAQSGQSTGRCMDLAGINPQESKASDAQILTRTPLGDMAAKAMPDPTRLGNREGGGAGEMVGSGVGNLGDVGAALAGIADAAQKDGGKLASSLGLAGAPAFSGGGGGGGSRGGGDNPFGNMFGAPGGGPMGGTSSMQFGTPSGPSDIWHTGTKLNLFEIIRGKYAVVTNRVQGGH